MRRKEVIILAAMLLASCGAPESTDLKLNDLGYFANRGVNVFVFNNIASGGFNDEKDSGIEIIHHGVRTVQGGAIRLCNTPEQWDLVPEITERKVDEENGIVEVSLRYDLFDFDSRLVVEPKGSAFEISVWLDKPVPAELEGDAGFNLEFLPSQYWLKTYEIDGSKIGRFPRYAVSNTVSRPNEEKVRQFKGYRTYDDRGTGCFVDPLPIETGHSMLFAPDDPTRMVKITSDGADLLLYDGRMVAQNGWFVLRSLLPAGKTGKVLTWTVEPNSVKGWVREPNIGFSQMGYTTQRPKVAVIELDKADKPERTASIIKIASDGSESKVFTGNITGWGDYFKYNYVKFDFSKVTEPGVYYIQYGDTRTNNFIISDDVYDKMTDATSDVWIPIHMNHMTVNEAYRIWHGEPFKEGYLQAPANTDHFDVHSQGPIDTKYKALELIPGLNVGGYFDAGDFDIETGSNISVVQNLVSIWERFHPERDETFVDEDQRYVDLHRPDGTPDVLQFIKHGVLNLVAQAENIGHMSQTLSNSVLDNYHHLGDAAAITDGLHYDPRLKPYQKSADGKSSGTPDDMWAFTTRNPGQDFRAATMFAAASRALRGYDDDLAARALKQSERLMAEATALMSGNEQGRRVSNVATNLQLFIATGEAKYKEAFESQIWESLDRNVNSSISNALDAVPYMDEAFKEKLRPYVEKYNEYVLSLEEDNPYGVPIGLGNWAGSGNVVSFGTTICTASFYYPDIVDKNNALKAADFIFGCHPYHNYSLAAAVGAARPKAVFYGNNRADFSFIPGNLAPGVLFRKPDHFENYDDWPFFWGQNEGTIAGNVSFLTFGEAFKNAFNQ